MARSKSYSRTKGHSYEVKIAKELRDLGFDGVVTSRQESKSYDDNKIDIIDVNGKLPIHIQLKSTQNIPSYFHIRSECSKTDKPFVIIWNKQVKKSKNICSAGELALIPKDLLYNLLKLYLTMNITFEQEEVPETPLTDIDAIKIIEENAGQSNM